MSAEDGGVAGSSTSFAYQVSEEWLVRFPSSPSSSQYRDLEMDADGNLYAVGYVGQGSFLVVKYAPDGTQLWVDSTDSGPAETVEVDNYGNVYAGGNTSHTISEEIVALRKYDSAGTVLWTLTNEPSIYAELPIRVADIAVDSQQNVYVAGTVQCSVECGGSAVAKVDMNGSIIWMRVLSNTGGPTTVDLDAAGNVYVAGNAGPTTFGNEIRAAKYTSDGDLLWLHDYHREACDCTDIMHDTALDATGSLYIVGSDSATPSPSTDVDAVLLKLDTSGKLLWAARSDVSSDEAWARITVAPDASVAVSGRNGAVAINGQCSNTATKTQTARYDTAGNQLWFHQSDLDPLFCNREEANDIAFDGDGNLFVAGTVAHSILITDEDIFALKYGPKGVPTWQAFIGDVSPYGFKYNEGWALQVDNDGGVYLAGLTQPSASGGQATLLKVPDPDADGDGCADDAEPSSNPLAGGLRDPSDPWDYGDMPIVTNSPLRDRHVRVGDILAVVQRYYVDDAGGTAPINRNSDPLSLPPATGYHPAFDRGVQNGPNPWNVAPPDGLIQISDIVYVVKQYFHDCA